jgi:hypothetical protein
MCQNFIFGTFPRTNFHWDLREENRKLRAFLNTYSIPLSKYYPLFSLYPIRFGYLALFGYYVLKDSPYLNWQLGGKSENISPLYFENYPCDYIPPNLDNIYLIRMSFHFFETVITMKNKYANHDFSELMLHHIVGIGMVIVSYATNFLACGYLVIFVHDVGDCFVCIFKLTVDISYMPTVAVAYIMLVVTWVYLRLFSFPMFCIKMLYEQAYFKEHVVLHEGSVFFLIMFFFTYLLHIFWFILIIKGFVERYVLKKDVTKKYL